MCEHNTKQTRPATVFSQQKSARLRIDKSKLALVVHVAYVPEHGFITARLTANDLDHLLAPKIKTSTNASLALVA